MIVISFQIKKIYFKIQTLFMCRLNSIQWLFKMLIFLLSLKNWLPTLIWWWWWVIQTFNRLPRNWTFKWHAVISKLYLLKKIKFELIIKMALFFFFFEKNDYKENRFNFVFIFHILFCNWRYLYKMWYWIRMWSKKQNKTK